MLAALKLGLSNAADLLIRVARWPAMFVSVALALAPDSGRAARRRAGAGSPGERNRDHPVGAKGFCRRMLLGTP